MTTLIPRPQYTERIAPFIDKNIIKVLTGQRRIGKSFILRQVMEEIRRKEPEAHIISINKELEQFRDIRTHEDLSHYLEPLLNKPGPHYLFIDEVQEIEGFQFCLRSLLAEEKCDIFCTGSNAQMLSGELATHLAGRSVSFDVHSLSYREFLAFHRLETGQESLKKYLTFGGMPYLAHIGLKADVPFEYLRSVYSTILLKDTVVREKIRNVHFLEDLVTYLADNIGNLFSANNISKFLKSQRVDLSPQVTLNYLRALSNAYLIHRVSRTEVGGMKIFETGEKFYFEDIGISHAIRGFNFRRDVHKVMENAVYLHLIQQGYSVHVGQLKEQEINFVADKSGDKLYVQVSLSVADEKTAAREFGNLLAVQDNYPKYVVTLNDMILGDNQEGIRHMNLEEFLLKE
ncbi:ATP-binding protein [uncultured Akkermansia sp.]|uniref:ATP-binding protein n=1 Tax=uncultured Akkermansia sp. TaxID=512294 RepID=UPI0025FB66E9|nr:ATP-binding protein [uncultured Akkermansia sp.]